MFRNSSISKKLTWTNMLVSGVALLLACASFIGYDLFTFRQTTVRNLSIDAQMVGTNSISALLFDDQNSAGNTLSVLRASPNIISAGILTLDGRPFAKFFRDQGAPDPVLPKLKPHQSETYQFNMDKVLLVRSIVFKGQPTGFVYIESGTERIRARLKLYVEISAVVLCISLLAALLISPIVQRAISAPIRDLADIAWIVSHDKDYSVRAPITNTLDEMSVLVEAFNSMLGQIQEHDTAMQRAQDELEQRVMERTNELNIINKELESFSYSVSHDLRAPLRAIDGFSLALLEDYSAKLDSPGQDHLRRVRLAAQRMSTLIDDLLNLSRVTRGEIRREKVDLSALVTSVADELRREYPDRRVEFVVTEGVTVEGDSRLLRVVIENLMGNAWKYTSAHSHARIEFGCNQTNGQPTYFVRDDGAGFDPRYSDRLFGAFQRLHGTKEFPGTGIGLATVQRIIQRHQGKIWAESAVEKGATFYFTL